MDDLSMDLRRLCRRSKNGSFGTRKNRERGLAAISLELKALGYKLPSARSLKPKHVTALVEKWQCADLGNDTIKNRLAWVRWWAENVNKASVVPRTNEELGIITRAVPANRAMVLEPSQLSRIRDVYVKGALLLQAAFGLRREEAIKFRPVYADQDSFIRLKASWTKGGRARNVPITSKHQREVLDLVKRIARDGALIPPGKTYVSQLKRYERETLSVALRKTHGLRHRYAQKRFRVLAGFACPLEGGKTRREMTPQEREADRAARMRVSRELGHNRLSVTDTYLGSAEHDG
ncbi:phage integrase N-terminal domain-containing protein [Salaquimonas pukyongi]|uniref:phage integrase N-terminal domain-containing protein n=1 Tax=Salaquimonas pukyongi TaxID=2712698 RepID=UPI00096BB83B|nr:phage integrase N-terminal domain-containing protein [Salaquimonas pukyongi]